ncbi:retrovirus-related pol polyprotein from transposon TNT 1-94 [Tanacetum coccineum]
MLKILWFETKLVLWQKDTDRKKALILKSHLLLLLVLRPFGCLLLMLINGPLKEEFYVSQPEGFIDPEFPDHVYRLKKDLYGLKEAPRAWYDKLSSFLIEHGFTKGIIDPTLFTRCHGGDILLVQVYVDDIIFGSTNPDFSKRFANLMKNNFEMSMMGELKFFLGLQVHQSPRGIFISQSQYAIELLKKHGLDECVSMSTPMATERLDADLQGTPTDQTTYRRMIGGLMYLTASRPDIAFATFVCARYQARPTVKHLKEVKRIFRYLRQSYNMGLWYLKDFGFELIAYSDADHVGCKDDCKSTSGGLQFLVIWMRTQLLDYGYMYNRIPMYCDSKSAIAISCNPVQHSKTKHIDIRYHFIKEHVEKGTVELYLVGTEYQLAGLFTKALPKERFEYLVHRIEFIIMAQPQRPADVHQDKLCLPNKRYALMDANKKIDLDNPLYTNEIKLMANIIQNHPLRFSIVASSSVPWIYLGQFWHTLQEGGSKYRLKFMLDRKEITMTLNDFRRIFHLPQATIKTIMHDLLFLNVFRNVPFLSGSLGFTLELRSASNFKMTGLIMQMLYCFVNNIHVDYVDLLGEGLHYALKHPSTQIPYPRFTKLIVGHYMTAFHEISGRARDKYNNLKYDVMVKNIFNSGKHKDGDGMTIPSWMITDKMKLTDHYRMTTSTPRSPNPDVDEAGSTPIPTTTEADDIILQDTIQLSLAEQKSCNELEAKQNVQKVEEHLIAEEIEKLVEGSENVETVEVASSTLRKNDNPIDLGTRLEPKSDKESPEVEITADSQHVNVNGEEEESAEDDYELKRRGKGKEVEETRNTQSPTTTRSLRIHSTLMSSNTEENSRKLMESVYGDLFEHHKTRGLDHGKITKSSGCGKDDCRCNSAGIARILQSEISLQINDAITNHIPSQKISEHGTFVSGESSSGQDYKSGLGPSTSSNQEQSDDFDFWMDSYATSDDELPTEKVSQELVDEMSKTVDEAKLRKVVDDYAETGLLWSLSVFIRSTLIWERVYDFQLVYGIIYKNNKKEKRVMRHQEIHKFCDATLKRVQEGLKRYNHDVKHGYVTSSLSKEDAEYMQLFEEEIEEWLRHRDQMRWWEMYVNGRQLGSRREFLV